MMQGKKTQPVERLQNSGTTVAVRWSHDMLIALGNDPSVSGWLKQSIRQLAQRDPLDALYDAELLCALMRDRWEVSTGMKAPDPILQRRRTMVARNRKTQHKGRRKRPKRSVAERVAALEADIARVRTREEARLIRVARKAGVFSRRIRTADLARLFATVPEEQVKASQLKQLEVKMTTLKRKATAEERRLDARRKILLGSFLIAQFEHKPDLKAEMQPELKKFLDQHRDAKVAKANKKLLADFLT